MNNYRFIGSTVGTGPVPSAGGVGSSVPADPEASLSTTTKDSNSCSALSSDL